MTAKALSYSQRLLRVGCAEVVILTGILAVCRWTLWPGMTWVMVTCPLWGGAFGYLLGVVLARPFLWLATWVWRHTP